MEWIQVSRKPCIIKAELFTLGTLQKCSRAHRGPGHLSLLSPWGSAEPRRAQEVSRAETCSAQLSENKTAQQRQLLSHHKETFHSHYGEILISNIPCESFGSRRHKKQGTNTRLTPEIAQKIKVWAKARSGEGDKASTLSWEDVVQMMLLWRRQEMEHLTQPGQTQHGAALHTEGWVSTERAPVLLTGWWESLLLK